MIMKSGKYEGLSGEQMVLKHPDHVQWYLQEYPKTTWSDEYRRLLHRFDAKPFVSRCTGCKGEATRMSAYRGEDGLLPWCDDCNPYRLGANDGKLVIVTTCAQALRHIDGTAEGNRNFKRRIIRGLAEAKGLPARVTVASAAAFFG